jgi:hypothetical protein
MFIARAERMIRAAISPRLAINSLQITILTS